MSETTTLPRELVERAIESLIVFSKSDGYDEDTKQAHEVWQALEKAMAAAPASPRPSRERLLEELRLARESRMRAYGGEVGWLGRLADEALDELEGAE